MNKNEIVVAETTALKQRGKPFQPGQSGNPAGRPKGTKNKLTEMVLSTIAKDFAENGVGLLITLRKEDPVSYLKMICSLLPRELVMKYEESPPQDYLEMSYEDLGKLVEETKQRRFIESLLAKD